MTANQGALGLSLVVWGLLGMAFMHHMEWMRPHMGLLLGAYGGWISAYLAAGALCVYAAIYWLVRKLGLGDLGRRMGVLERDLGRDAAHDPELARALARQRTGDGL